MANLLRAQYSIHFPKGGGPSVAGEVKTKQGAGKSGGTKSGKK
jgi:hypothetical protein